MKMSVTVCDVCKDAARETVSYTVKQGQRAAIRDLCKEHAEPIERLLIDPREPTRKAKARKRGPTRKREVVTIEQIEERKRLTS